MREFEPSVGPSTFTLFLSLCQASTSPTTLLLSLAYSMGTLAPSAAPSVPRTCPCALPTPSFLSSLLPLLLHRTLFKSDHYPKDPQAALHDAFLQVDQSFLEMAKGRKLRDGSTGLVALIHQQQLLVANVGDSRGQPSSPSSSSSVLILLKPCCARAPKRSP